MGSLLDQAYAIEMTSIVLHTLKRMAENLKKDRDRMREQINMIDADPEIANTPMFIDRRNWLTKNLTDVDREAEKVDREIRDIETQIEEIRAKLPK